MTPRNSAADTRSDTVVATPTNTSAIAVKVTIANQGRRAKIEPDEICAQSGDTVQWLFENVPTGYEPMIQFTTAAATTPSTTITTGPLKAICLEAESISGVVRDDVRGEFSYRVLLIPRPGFGPATLDLTSGHSEPPTVCIVVDPKDPQTSG